MKQRFFLILLLFVAGLGCLSAQKVETAEFVFDFGEKQHSLASGYKNNRPEINRLESYLESLKADPDSKIVSVEISGFTSLESTHEANSSMSRKRIATLEEMLKNNIDVSQSLIKRNPDYIDWQWLKERIDEADVPNKAQAIAIMNRPRTMMNYFGNFTRDRRIFDLRWLGKVEVWNYMEENLFPEMRKGKIAITVERPTTVRTAVAETVVTPAPEVVVAEAVVADPAPVETSVKDTKPKDEPATPAMPEPIPVLNDSIKITWLPPPVPTTRLREDFNIPEPVVEPEPESVEEPEPEIVEVTSVETNEVVAPKPVASETVTAPAPTPVPTTGTTVNADAIKALLPADLQSEGTRIITLPGFGDATDGNSIIMTDENSFTISADSITINDDNTVTIKPNTLVIKPATVIIVVPPANK